MNFTFAELNLIRQWFDAIQDLNPAYLSENDLVLGQKIKEIVSGAKFSPEPYTSNQLGPNCIFYRGGFKVIRSQTPNGAREEVFNSMGELIEVNSTIFDNEID